MTALGGDWRRPNQEHSMNPSTGILTHLSVSVGCEGAGGMFWMLYLMSAVDCDLCSIGRLQSLSDNPRNASAFALALAWLYRRAEKRWRKRQL